MGGEECTAGQGLHVCHFVCVIPSFTAVRLSEAQTLGLGNT